MTKVLLIKSASVNKPEMYSRFPPPLGLLYIASALRRAGYEVKIIDTRLCRNKPDYYLKEFRSFKPQVIGFSSLTLEAKITHQMAEKIKKEEPDIKIIVGGPHATFYPEQMLQNKNIDYVVTGEGEITIVELIRQIEKENPYPQTEGIAYLKDNQFCQTKPRAPIEDLDSLPFPAWDLIDPGRYSRAFKLNAYPKIRTHMPIITSRGCPYRCIGCHCNFGNTYRARNPENVVEEIKTINRDLNIPRFNIFDQCFNFDFKRTERICNLIGESGLEVKFTFSDCLMSNTVIDEELLFKLKNAGVYLIDFFIGPASFHTQKLTKRIFNLKTGSLKISQASKMGIFTRGDSAMGYPNETKERILETIAFVTNLRLDFANFYIIHPYTYLKTEYFPATNLPPESKDIDFDNLSWPYAKFNLSGIQNRELFRLRRKAYMTFYLRRGRILRLVKILLNFLSNKIF